MAFIIWSFVHVDVWVCGRTYWCVAILILNRGSCESLPDVLLESPGVSCRGQEKHNTQLRVDALSIVRKT